METDKALFLWEINDAQYSTPPESFRQDLLTALKVSHQILGNQQELNVENGKLVSKTRQKEHL